MPWQISEFDWCSSAVLPEKMGVDEMAQTVLEEKTCNTVEEAQALVDGLAEPTEVVVVKAMVPKLPAEITKAIEKLRAKLPESREKLRVLLQPDPETGEPSWRSLMEQEIIERNQQVKVATRSCKGCGSSIATAHIRTFLCPVCLTYPFLQTATDEKAFAAREERIKALQDEVENADQKIAELREEGLKQSDEFKRVWLVFQKAD